MTISRAEIKERLDDNQRKIADLAAFRDDPKINMIIRVLQRQIARDNLELALDEAVAPCCLETQALANGR